jgi:26S proteasome non-ATPase regulatory subunit 9
MQACLCSSLVGSIEGLLLLLTAGVQAMEEDAAPSSTTAAAAAAEVAAGSTAAAADRPGAQLQPFAVIDEVTEGSPAAVAGLQLGDLMCR